jgi:hypothetical protein
MRRQSISASGGEPSFFYLMMADGCFQRATSARHPNADGMLRNIGRDYLTKATEVSSVFSQSRRSQPNGAALDRTEGANRGAEDGPDRQHIGGTG